MAVMFSRLLGAVVGLLIWPFSATADQISKIIFTDEGIYIENSPFVYAHIGENITLIELGRRFSSCRVSTEYFSGDDEGIATYIQCGDITVSVNISELGDIEGFSTFTKGAGFADGIEVGDPLVNALGTDVFCNLCTEDEPPFCKADNASGARYDVSYDYDNCRPTHMNKSDRCWGEYQIKSCVTVTGIISHDARNYYPE